jgi:hypothetical protein|tara:strand:+ start:675 stop:1544 length:870 start_codon:yes stop_codon:yes gene_type:complete
MRSTYFSQGTRSEKNLYEDLIIEQLKIYGHDVHYMPRENLFEDGILGNTTDKFTDEYMIEMYVEEVNGFAGQGDLIGKFGLDMKDEITYVVARRTFELLVDQPSNTLTFNRPREGDVIYMPLFKKFWQIDFVEDEDPMYQISDLPIFKLKCSTWDYASESVETGLAEIDNKLDQVTMDVLENQITLESGTTSAGSLLTENISGDVEAVLTEAGEFLIDETDGDNILYEDDPDYNEYIILEDALTDNLATESTDADNKAFDAAAGLDDFDPNNDIFDFSENNPFGDPRSK